MAQVPQAETASSATAALRFGAVLAAAGPVILMALEIGGESTVWVCSGTFSGSHALESASRELLFWAELLLPVVLAGLVLRAPRRATLTAALAIGSVLALGLFTAIFLPGTDPCGVRELPVVLPWLLIACYPVAAVSLALAARSPLSRTERGGALWMLAVAAAAWTAITCRLPTMTWSFPTATDVLTPGLRYGAPESFWDAFNAWVSGADAIGLPIVIVALAAAAKGASARWGRPAGAGAGALLLVFALLDAVVRFSPYEGDFQEHPLGLVRWPLLLAAALVVAATWSRREPLSVTGVVRSLRSRIPGRPKDLAVLVVIVVAAVWLVISSFEPASP
ncbi:hypothetical protein [Streptosporangium sp. 'caverna']|uniref:hypothetical protein n=1 Tax=Streptosporangium sp. 'caverna' TaxID=2202249 RepID=UPI000D7E70E7|nr:hypothetical protein [Streptosporangium sp. 'caverna']AWS47768.1 hypothetical protein DKM19_47280 [Streptosporangium sp. 'caverna']